ncbi:MAG TPA: hypothetical protein VM911_04320 [Pyrinomonadaceae bacterium]|jgi:hypothetical protein|nr:hypothetical protein [Pyrinomonadaceae bacterium]
MIKLWLSLTLIYLLVFTAAPVLARAKPGKQQADSVEQIKMKLERIGTGEKARATVRLKNGTKLKGFIYQMGASDFVLKDKKTLAPTQILYSDVAKVESNRGHSRAKWIGIGAAIGVGAFLAILGISLAHLD